MPGPDPSAIVLDAKLGIVRRARMSYLKPEAATFRPEKLKTLGVNEGV